MSVPFLDLKAGYLEIKDDLDAAYHRVMDSGHYIMGPELEAFEQEFAAYCGVKHVIGVGNGLEALALSLRARGIGKGDEVIVPAHTFVATWLAVSQVGAVPVPVLCDERTYNLDPERLPAALTARTKAIVPVHLYGQPADMDPIMAFARENGLFVLEDAAQSQGAHYKNRKCGALGDAAGTSFYPGKNLGGYGDGGAVMTSDDDVADRVRVLRNYGSKKKYHHIEAGSNSRLDELQAAFLRARLRVLDTWNTRRKRVAAAYREAFADLDLVAPFVPEWADPNWHLFVVRVKNREAFQAGLAEKGIQTLIHYPVPPHAQLCYRDLEVKGDFSSMERLASEVVTLPMSPYMDAAQTEEVIEAVRAQAKR